MRLAIAGMQGFHHVSRLEPEAADLLNDKVWSFVFRTLDYANAHRPIAKVFLIDGKSPVTNAVIGWCEHSGVYYTTHVATYQGSDAARGRSAAMRNRRMFKDNNIDTVITFTYGDLSKDAAANLLHEIGNRFQPETFHNFDVITETREF